MGSIDLPAEIAIGVGSAIVGALLTYFLTLWLERRKQRAESSRSAYQACLQLRETLANWLNEIADATRVEESTAAVRKRLETVYEHQQFQRQVRDRFSDLEDEPLCSELFGKTNVFSSQAFESKGRISMALSTGDFMRDYTRHRDEALRDLRSVYDDFQRRVGKGDPGSEKESKAVMEAEPRGLEIHAFSG